MSATTAAPGSAPGGSGRLAMVVGYAFVGASAFVLLAAGPRLLGHAGHSALAITWTVVTILGVGIAAPGEQTITRGIAAGADTGILRAVGRRLVAVPVLAGLLVVAGMPGLGVWGITVLGSAVFWVVLAGARGVLAGRHRFGAYAGTLMSEAAARIALVVAALLLPDLAVPLLASAIAVPLAASAALGWWLLRGGRGAGGPPVAEDSRWEQAAITSVALLGQVCLSTAPLWLHQQSPDQALAGAFVSATTYMRIPLLLSAGLFGPVLADASRQYAARNRHGVLARTLQGLAAGVGGSTAVVGILLLASGPALMLFYGSDPGLSDAVLLRLGLSTIGYIAALIATQMLYGCERAGWAAAAWAAPAVLTTVLFAHAGGDAEAMAGAMAAGQLVAALTLLALVPRALPPAVR